jgi:dolichyl-phosphate beta-glucosyltransferase
MLNDGKTDLNPLIICHNLSFRAFDVELLYIAEKLNIPIVEVDVNWQEIPGSKLDPFTASLQMGIDILAIWLRYFLGIWTINRKKD